MPNRGQRIWPKLLSQTSAIALLSEHGWTKTIGGKHVVKMEKDGERPVTLPHHKGSDYGKDLTNAILREAGLKTGTKTDEE